jgi:hypothetical protein
MGHRSAQAIWQRSTRLEKCHTSGIAWGRLTIGRMFTWELKVFADRVVIPSPGHDGRSALFVSHFDVKAQTG